MRNGYINKITFLILVIAALFQTSSCSVFSDFEEWEERAAEITQGCITQYDKAKAIFDWECKNIKYDYTYSVSHGRDAWQARTGVCQAFSELFVLLAQGCGIKAEVVSGNARTLSYLEGNALHAWVKAKVEKGWILLDPTWGACYLEYLHGGDTSRYCDEIGHPNGLHYEWFDVEPEIMIFTHFPREKENQLLEKTISSKQYTSLPLLEPRALQWGWNAADLLDYFLKNTDANPPYFYNNKGPEYRGVLRFINVPYSIEEGKDYTIVIESQLDYCEPYGMGEWTKEGNIYTCTIEGSNDVYGLWQQCQNRTVAAILSYHEVQVRPSGKEKESDDKGAPWIGIFVNNKRINSL